MATESNQIHPFHYPAATLRAESMDLRDQGHEKAADDMQAAANYLDAAATPAPLSDAELAELVSKHLAGSYYCGRVWSAWQAGTMSEDDFAHLPETDIPHELAQDIQAFLLARLATAPKWIAVTERLPEEGTPVLVCEHRDDCDINLAEYLPDEVDEDDPDKWEYGYGEWGRPSFWMPLPAQPVAQQEALCAQIRAKQEGGQPND